MFLHPAAQSSSSEAKAEGYDGRSSKGRDGFRLTSHQESNPSMLQLRQQSSFIAASKGGTRQRGNDVTGSKNDHGRLVIIATPIGNLGDMSPRAIESLKACDLILAEDTRQTKKLLSHFGLAGHVESFHEHNEDKKANSVLDRLQGGLVVGLVSDAGTPTLSDPGFKLVRRARELGIRIEPIPGPFAAALAVAASGLPPTPFAFYGFAPRKAGERRHFYEELAERSMTAVVYESPNRLVASLRDALAAMGEIEITIGRELTKLHEELLSGTISSVVADLESRESIRGEVTIVFAPVERVNPTVDTESLRTELETLLKDGLRRTEALKVLAERHGLRKNDLYGRL